MFNKKIVIILFLILLSTNLYSLEGESLGFSAIKSKYIDVDINIVIPINITNYNTTDKFTLKTPMFYNSRSQRVNLEAFYYDSNLQKVFADIQKDKFGNSIAVFDINSITKSKYLFYIQGNVKSENKIILNTKSYDLSKEITDYNSYKLPTENIQSNTSEIISMASILKKSDNALEEIVNITNWIHQNIEYDLNFANKVDDSLTVLSNRKGVCDEFAILEAAILRARGFPVKYVSGVANTTNKWESHAWLKVYVPNQGWVPVDPTYAEVGLVDSSHIVLSEAGDPRDIEDRVTATGNLNIEFGNKEMQYKINERKSYSDMGYNNLITFNLSFNKKMKENSLFSIKETIKNTTANPISILVVLETNEQFKLLYPNSDRKIIYLDSFEEKEFVYHYKLPDLNVSGNSYRIYPFKLDSQIGTLLDSVEIYPNKGLFEEAFFVSDPIFYFKDKNTFFIDLEIFNYTSTDKNLEFNLDLNSENLIKEKKIFASNTKELYSKKINDIRIGKLIFSISGDYMFSKSINILPSLKIKVINNKDLDSNDDSNIQDINKDKHKDKIKKIEPKQNSKNKFIPIILIILFFITIILSIILKHKKRDI